MSDRLLICTTPEGWVMPQIISPFTQPIVDLLANGVNTKLTLTKDDGSEWVYELIQEKK